jgi:hypothetical protein
MRTLVIAVHDGSDQLACVHLAESDDELEEVLRVAVDYGPVWKFPLVDGELLQEWFERDTANYPLRGKCPACGTWGPVGVECCAPGFCANPGCNEVVVAQISSGDDAWITEILCPDCFQETKGR